MSKSQLNVSTAAVEAISSSTMMYECLGHEN